MFHSADGRDLGGTVLAAAVHECPLFSRMGPTDMTYAVAAGPAPSTFCSGSAACSNVGVIWKRSLRSTSLCPLPKVLEGVGEKDAPRTILPFIEAAAAGRWLTRCELTWPKFI